MTKTTTRRASDTEPEAPLPLVTPPNGEAVQPLLAEVLEKEKEEAEEPPPAVKPGRSGIPLTGPIRDLKNKEDGALHDWVLATFGENATSIKISVSRSDPKYTRDPETGQDVNVTGHLHTYTDLIDEDRIKADHGGGRYSVKLQRVKDDGRWTFAGQREIVIAGQPKIPREPARGEAKGAGAAGSGQGTENPTVLKEAMNMMRESVTQYREDARRGGSGMDPGALMDAVRAANGPLQQQITMLVQQIEAKDRMITSLQERKPPEDAFKTDILKGLMEDRGAQVQAVRLAYESEIRALKDGQASAEQRVRDASERDREQDRRSHDREISALKQAHDLAMASLKSSSDMQTVLLKDEVRRLERASDELRTEVKDLRAKKDKTLLETVKDINDLKEGLGMDDDGEKSTLDRIVGLATDPDAIKAVAGMFTGRGQPPPQQQVQQAPPQVVENKATGERFVLHNGQLVAAKKRAPRKPVPQNEDGTEATPDEVPQIDQVQLDTTIKQMELAFYNSVEPETAAAAAQGAVPPEIMKAISDHGLDGLLSKMGKLDKSSPFSTQAGRNWIRKLGKALVGGE